MNEKIKHTPGPWAWIEAGADDYSGGIYHKELVQKEFIGEGEDSILYHGADWPMSDADAKLIAAAPDLLEALRGLFENCCMIHKHWGENDNSKAAAMAIESAEEAIKKATS